jgi:poly(A) polymerase
MKKIIEDLKVISLNLDIDCYILGEYVINKLLNSKNENKCIEVIFDGEINLIVKEFEDLGYITKKDNDNTAIIKNSVKKIKIYVKCIDNITIEKELENRSFTVNCIALKLIDNKIIDPFKGRNHLKSRIIQEVNEESIKKNPLIIMDAVNMYIQYGMHFSAYTEAHIREFGNALKDINDSSLFSKLMDIIKNDKSGVAFEILDQYELLKYLIPDIDKLKTIGKCKYHVEDVFTHMNTTYKVFKQFEQGSIELKNFDSDFLFERIDNLYVKDILALAAFLHDVGKYRSYAKEGETVSFAGHEITGKHIVEEIFQKFQLNYKVSEMICSTVEGHMYPLTIFKEEKEDIKERFFKSFTTYIKYIILISFCDILATSTFYDPNNEQKSYTVFIEQLMKGYVEGNF